MLHGAAPSAKLRCCALVGSSGILLGKGYGAEIDAFDTVIRVNRLPSPELRADFGAKTDIAFVNDRHWRRPTVPVLGGAERNCTLAGECNFTVILSSWLPDAGRVWDEIARAWQAARCPVGHEVDDLGDALRGYLPLAPGGREHYMPSCGLHAFFTFATQCAYTRLYGFGGPQSSNADGHPVGDYHSFPAELRLMGLIDQGNATKLRGLLRKAKEKRKHVPGWIQERLLELRGRIRVTSA